MAQLQEWAFDCEKQNRSSEVNAEFDAEKSGNRSQRDVVVARAKLRDEVHDDFLNQVCAVSDAGHERGAGNCNATKK